MNFFEFELIRIANMCDNIAEPRFAGSAFFGDLGGDNRVKLEFATTGHADHYSALRATVLSRTDGKIDSVLFHFKDIWGKKQVGNPSFQGGIEPHIWTNSGKSNWYVYKPTAADYKRLATEIDGYLNVFTDRSAEVEKPSVRDQIKAGAPAQQSGAKTNPTARAKSGQER